MAVILLVDDEQSVLSVTSTVLRQEGHEVLTASNGLEALAVFLAHAETIGLVLTDLKMPEMDGYELVGRIRETKADAKIVCMSGYLEDECPKDVRLVRKPFLPEEIRACVSEILGA